MYIHSPFRRLLLIGAPIIAGLSARTGPVPSSVDRMELHGVGMITRRNPLFRCASYEVLDTRSCNPATPPAMMKMKSRRSCLTLTRKKLKGPGRNGAI